MFYSEKKLSVLYAVYSGKVQIRTCRGQFSLKNTDQMSAINEPGAFLCAFYSQPARAMCPEYEKEAMWSLSVPPKTRFAYNPRRFLLCVLLGVYSEKLPFWAPPGHFSFKKTHRFHFPLFCKRYGFYSEKPVAEALGFAGFRRKQPPKCIEKGALRGLWGSFSRFSMVIQV